MCKWWFTSAVSREDVLRRGGEDLHQLGIERWWSAQGRSSLKRREKEKL